MVISFIKGKGEGNVLVMGNSVVKGIVVGKSKTYRGA